MAGAIMDSTSVHWNTPPELVDVATRILNGIDLDPCSNEHSTVGAAVELRLERGEDGLQADWSDRNVYVNPPYGDGIDAWIEKGWRSWERGAHVLMLIPAAVETRYWEQNVWPLASRVCFLSGRVRFWLEGRKAPATITRPVAFVLFGSEPGLLRRFDMELWPLGEVVLPRLQCARDLAAGGAR